MLKGARSTSSKGEVVAIIGRTGSGKSTLLRCINGLETDRARRIAVDGVERATPARRRSAQAAPATSAWCSRASTCFRILTARAQHHAGADGA